MIWVLTRLKDVSDWDKSPASFLKNWWNHTKSHNDNHDLLFSSEIGIGKNIFMVHSVRWYASLSISLIRAVILSVLPNLEFLSVTLLVHTLYWAMEDYMLTITTFPVVNCPVHSFPAEPLRTLREGQYAWIHEDNVLVNDESFWDLSCVWFWGKTYSLSLSTIIISCPKPVVLEDILRDKNL